MALPSLTQLGLVFQQDERPQLQRPVFRDWDLESLAPLEAVAQGYLASELVSVSEAQR